jgi:hypothetical protein
MNWMIIMIIFDRHIFSRPFPYEILTDFMRFSQFPTVIFYGAKSSASRPSAKLEKAGFRICVLQ